MQILNILDNFTKKNLITYFMYVKKCYFMISSKMSFQLDVVPELIDVVSPMIWN